MIDINKKYETKDARAVRIFMTDAGGDYPVIGAILFKKTNWLPFAWSENGIHDLDNGSRCDLIEVSPYKDWEVDKKIMVWDEHHKKTARHFSHISENGNPCVFKGGSTSFTSDGETAEWTHAEAAEE